MRSAILLSVLTLVLFVALALLGTPKLFDGAASRSIEVELVRPEEAPPEKPRDEKPKEPATEPGKPDQDKMAAWDPLPDKPDPWPEPAPDKPQPQPEQKQAAAQPAAQSPSPQSQPQQPQPAKPSIFEPANIPALLNLPNAPESGFDSESTTAANISPDDRTAFKAHLRKCWKLPGSVAPGQATRVVLRVYLRRNGSLASEPVLIEASASRDGPAVMQTAIRALKECQPYGFLPAEKYSEWKVLDLSFSPRDMAGG